jgi:uncharacterized protein YkwD
MRTPSYLITALMLFAALLGVFLPARPAHAAGAPALVNLSVTPGTIQPNTTVTITATFSDPAGADNIDRAWLGFSNCSVNPGEAYSSNFERNLANYFGLVVYNFPTSYNYQLAQINRGAACTGGTYGESPWGSVSPYQNVPGTVELTGVARSTAGNQLTLTLSLRLSSHPAGSFPIYVMARNKQGLFNNGSPTASWSRTAYSLLVSAPPTPTPLPNHPPVLQSVTVSPNPAGPDSLLTIRAVVSDPQGAGDIRRVFAGLAPCSAATYAAEMSRFEHNLANFVGLAGTAPAYGNTLWLARSNIHGECSSIRDTLPVWGAAAPQANAFGSALLHSFSFTQSGSSLTMQDQVQLKHFPAGVYPLYAAVMDARGVYQNNQTSGVWTKTGTQLTVTGSSDVLVPLNAYRAMANLPPVTGSSLWDNGNRLHARYAVKNDDLSHQESASNPYYSLEGASAAQSSLLVGTPRAGLTDPAALNVWMSGPFHALQILDPRLKQVGYGAYRENDGYYRADGSEGLQAAAGLDTYRGLDPFAVQSFPLFYPAAGQRLPINAYLGGETPDPLAPCAGYSTPSGPPIIVQFGSGTTPVHLQLSSLKQGTAALALCAYTETSYTHPDLSAQSLGRSILGGHDAVVLIPKYPLLNDTSYTVSLAVNGKAYTWSFRTAADAVNTVSMPFLAPGAVR